MNTVTILLAKTHLSRLLAEVEVGGEVVIARGNTPVARLVPQAIQDAPRPPGATRGRTPLGADFEAPLPDDIAEGFGSR